MHGDLTTKHTLFRRFNYCLFLSFIFCLQIKAYFIPWCALMLLGRFWGGGLTFPKNKIEFLIICTNYEKPRCSWIGQKRNELPGDTFWNLFLVARPFKIWNLRVSSLISQNSIIPLSTSSWKQSTSLWLSDSLSKQTCNILMQTLEISL